MRYSWRSGRQKEPQQGIVKRNADLKYLHKNINALEHGDHFNLAHNCILSQYSCVFLCRQVPLQVPLSDCGAR